MKTTQSSPKYIEWISAEDMHTDSTEWASQLEFAKDEHLFFEHVITTYTSQLLAFKDFSSDKELVDTINRSFKKNLQLLAEVTAHQTALQIMVDGIDQPKDEKKYKETHRKLAVEVAGFLHEYHALKTQLFAIITTIRKEEKQRFLFDKKH